MSKSVIIIKLIHIIRVKLLLFINDKSIPYRYVAVIYTIIMFSNYIILAIFAIISSIGLLASGSIISESKAAIAEPPEEDEDKKGPKNPNAFSVCAFNDKPKKCDRILDER